jgi:hypothetical protein
MGDVVHGRIGDLECRPAMGRSRNEGGKTSDARMRPMVRIGIAAPATLRRVSAIGERSVSKVHASVRALLRTHSGG